MPSSAREATTFHSGGLHGVGSSVVNALSRKLVATIQHDGYKWQQAFLAGQGGRFEARESRSFSGHGTTIAFEPQSGNLQDDSLQPEWIKAHLEDMAYIHRGLDVTFRNEVTKEAFDLTHPGGIPEFFASCE